MPPAAPASSFWWRLASASWHPRSGVARRWSAAPRAFAAPHVSGAAALVLDAAPFLSAAEVVVELLLASATDLGAPGTDPVYGRGLVDLAAALGPQGPLSVPPVLRPTAPARRWKASALQLGPALSAPGPTSAGRSSSTAMAAPTGSISTAGRGGRAAPGLPRWLAPGRGQLRSRRRRARVRR